jgi:hypothetical protein
MKLTKYRGDTDVWPVACKQGDGSVLNVSSGTLWFTIKSSTRLADAQAVAQKTIGDGITVNDGPTGEITVTLSPADTSGVYAPSVLKWGLQYVTTGDQVFTLATGDLQVDPDVTFDIA